MRKIISLVMVISLIIPAGYMFFEPQLISGQWNTLFASPADAATSTTAVSLTVTGELTLSCDATTTLNPSIAGMTGGTATGTFNCTVTTNNNLGYNLTLQKNQKIQLADVADQRFDDYTTSTATSIPDWDWDTVAAGQEEFGFAVNSSASTTDVVQLFRDNGTSACNTGSSVSAWHCWAALPTTTSTVQVLNRTTLTPAAGVLTTFGLRAQAGSGNSLQSGTYTATTTSTVLAN